ncbi:MAG: terminase small subunit [Gammaproteobacteria bacterium]|nr:terminase small subunit [Gammaproteobacteria bacterium]
MASQRIRNPFPTLDDSVSPKPGSNGVSPNSTDGVRPLNPQQNSFVKYYLANNYKAADAAEAAGYNRLYGAQLLQMPNIQDAIRKEIDRRNRRIDIDQDAVLQEVANVAFSNLVGLMADFGKGRKLTIKSKEELTEEQQRTMASISETYRGNQRTIKFRVHDKLRALTLLAQNLGLLDGSGRQVDPASMVRRLRDAASRAEDSLPTTPEGAYGEDYDTDDNELEQG